PYFFRKPFLHHYMDSTEKYIGKTDIVFHELLSDTIHIDIYHVKPAENRNYHTLITSGMSALPMTPPEKFKECKYAELYICLPADWDLSDEGMRDGKNYWPIRCLKALARFPHEYKTWLWPGHSVPSGNPPTPFAENVGFCGIMLLPPIAMDPGFRELQINEEKTINFIAVIPLYEEEMNYKIKHGWRKLADRFDKYQINEIVDINRRNVCKRSFWPFK
ncbi:MAG TPA: suppressor of fused domain protein, partial [Bacillota bacterium]|nr:suppressor of fused domain protein [Bacillota bacterium]